MKKIGFAFVLAAIVATVGVSLSAQTAAPKKYLNPGASPQNPDRQPGPGEEVVIADTDICDPAWGTKLPDKKVDGCYHAGSATIRNKTTGLLAAMFGCGNEPSLKHKVTGKVVQPAEVPTIAAAVEKTVAEQVNATARGIVEKMPETVDVNVHVDGQIDVVHSGKVKLRNLPAPKPDTTTPTPVTTTSTTTKSAATGDTSKKNFWVSKKGIATEILLGSLAGYGVYKKLQGQSKPQPAAAAVINIINIGLPLPPNGTTCNLGQTNC